MTQRNNPNLERIIHSSLWVYPDFSLKWPPLHRTQTIKHDLDKYLVEQNIMPTTDKTELNKMVKK